MKKIKFTQGYKSAVWALAAIWYNLHKQRKRKYKHFSNTVIGEETGRKLEYRHLIEHPKFRDD